MAQVRVGNAIRFAPDDVGQLLDVAPSCLGLRAGAALDYLGEPVTEAVVGFVERYEDDFRLLKE